MSRDATRERLLAILVKDEAAFEALAERLAAAMTRAWSLGVAAAFRRALEELRGVDPARFTREDEARIVAAIEAHIGAEPMRQAMQGPLLSLPEAIYRVGAAEGARPAGVDVRFGVRDETALELVRRFDLHWIGRHWDAGTRQAVTDAVAEFFERGWSYETLAERLAETFGGIEDRGAVYWQLTADTIASKTRELGRIAGYEQAQVRYVQVRAHIDERTTPICRSLHGRLIRLSTLQRQRDEYLAAIERGRMDAAKAAWPMMPPETAFAEATRVLPGNVGLPPYHFRCRTVTVAYLGMDPEAVEQDVDRWRIAVQQRERLSVRGLKQIVRRAMLARWDEEGLARHLKHARQGIAAYNQSALDTIRRGGRDIALALLRGGDVAAVFAAPYEGRAANGDARLRVTVVNLQRLSIVTHHVRSRLDSAAYAIDPMVQPRGATVQRSLAWW